MSAKNLAAAAVRVGVGGWTFAPWRSNFYPAGLAHDKELGYASRQLSVIEINGTYYGLQKPATFAKWREQTPDDFVFSLKASRHATNRRVLAEAGESIKRFVNSGITELGPKLGPIVWQFAPTKRFDAADFERFLGLLPSAVQGVPLRHAVDVRHASFKCTEYLALARRHRVTTVFTESDDYPALADVTGDFIYTRIMRNESRWPEGFAPQVLNQIAECALLWQQGQEPHNLPRIEPPLPTNGPRDVFVFFISGAKEKAPAAAMAVRQRVG